MKEVRLSLSAVLALVAVSSAGAFAAGRAISPASPPATASPPLPDPAPRAAMPAVMGDQDESLPPGHPPIDTMGQAGPMAPGAAAAPGAPAHGGPATAESSLEWTAPARWQLVPNASTMRLATYKVPRAPGDTDDAELSITQAGGSVEANAERWIGQFDEAARKTAKKTTRKIGSLDVTIVEVQGTYSGGMGKDPSPGSGFALLGAIVSTPGMPHFFKLTGPAKTVLAARAELDAMLASLVVR